MSLEAIRALAFQSPRPKVRGVIKPSGELSAGEVKGVFTVIYELGWLGSQIKREVIELEGQGMWISVEQFSTLELDA